jgi:hypothetical protein
MIMSRSFDHCAIAASNFNKKTSFIFIGLGWQLATYFYKLHVITKFLTIFCQFYGWKLRPIIFLLWAPNCRGHVQQDFYGRNLQQFQFCTGNKFKILVQDFDFGLLEFEFEFKIVNI